MSLDLFENDALSAFDIFMPLGWLKNGLVSAPQKSNKAFVKSRRGFDLHAFLRKGIAALATGSAVLASGAVSAVTTPIVSATATQHLKWEWNAHDAALADQCITRRVALNNSQTGRTRFMSDVLGQSGTFKNSIDLMRTGRFHADNLPESILSPPGTTLQHAANLPSPPHILMQFTPTPEMYERILDIARVLDRIGNLVAYEGDEGEVVLEAGPRGSSLTVLLQAHATTAMYRTSAAYELKNLQVLTFSPKPGHDELEDLTLSYSRRHSSLYGVSS